MKHPLNPQKSRKLRPVRIALAVLVAALAILVIKLSAKTTATTNEPAEPEPAAAIAPVAGAYYDLSGFSDLIDAELKDEGIPAEEYGNLSEYLSKDEIFKLEAKATLAEKIDGNIIEAADLSPLLEIFGVDEASIDEQLDYEPAEYLSLKDLTDEYYKTLNTTEDYDIIEE